MAKLTKRYIDSLTTPDTESILWDDELSGFGLRLYPTGRKVYVVQYKLHGRTRRKTLGKHGVITADEARKDAKVVQADVHMVMTHQRTARHVCAALRSKSLVSGS
jgi:hypothetical protein